MGGMARPGECAAFVFVLFQGFYGYEREEMLDVADVAFVCVHDDVLGVGFLTAVRFLHSNISTCGMVFCRK